MTAPYNDPKVRLNHTVVCHVPRDIVKILPNTRHLAPLDLTNSLAISWQRNCTSTLFLSQNIGEGTKDIVSPLSKSWEEMSPTSPLKLGPCWSDQKTFLTKQCKN